MSRRPKCSLSCQRPLTRLLSDTIPAPPLIRSLYRNRIGDEGALALAAILEETQIQELECAASPERSLFCQRPIDSPQHPALPPCSQSLGKQTRL